MVIRYCSVALAVAVVSPRQRRPKSAKYMKCAGNVDSVVPVKVPIIHVS